MIQYRDVLNGIKKAMIYTPLVTTALIAACHGGYNIWGYKVPIPISRSPTSSGDNIHQPTKTTTHSIDSIVTDTPTPPEQTKPNLVFYKPEEIEFKLGPFGVEFDPVRITNEGEVDTKSYSETGWFGASVYLDGKQILQYLVREKNTGSENLNVGEVAELSSLYLGNLTPGKHKIRIEIDPENYVAESREDDNTHEREFELDTHRGIIPEELKKSPPNLAFYNPKQLKDGTIQVINNGDSTAQGYVGGNESLFGVTITVDGEVRLDYAVRKEGKIGSEKERIIYPEGSDILNVNEVSLQLDYNYLLFGLGKGKHRVRFSIDPQCRVYEPNKRDNNHELEINVSQDGKTEIINASPLELTVFEHCTQRFSWSENLNTNTTFDEWKKNGDVMLARSSTLGDHKVNYWIHTGEYSPYPLFEATSVDRDEFLDRVQNVFSQTLPYTDRVTGTSIDEYNVVVVYGILNNTFSTSLNKTDTIVINAEKWNRRTKETNGSDYIVVLSAAHEDYHLRNYRTDPDESQFGREFSAIVHEAGMLANVFDRKTLEDRLTEFTELLNVNSLEYDHLYSQDVRRALAYYTALEVLDSKGLHTLEKLAQQLLLEQGNGIDSFDKTARGMGLGFTFEDIWNKFKVRNGL